MPPRTFTAKHSPCSWRDQSLNIRTSKSLMHIFIQMIGCIYKNVGLPWRLSGKESACSAGDPRSIPGLGRSAGEGDGYPILAWRIPWTEEPGGLPRDD